MLRYKVLFDQKLDKRVEQGIPSLANVMNKLEKAKIKGRFSCEIPRCGHNQPRSRDQKPSIVFTWNPWHPSPAS